MSLNGTTVEIEFEGDAASALETIAQNLEKLGYALKDKEDGGAKFKFDGKWITADPEKMRHYLKIKHESGTFHFDFNTGLIASTWTESDREWAKARATEAMSGLK